MTLLKRLSVDRCAFYLDQGTVLQLNGRNWANGKKTFLFMFLVKLNGDNLHSSDGPFIIWKIKAVCPGAPRNMRGFSLSGCLNLTFTYRWTSVTFKPLPNGFTKIWLSLSLPNKSLSIWHYTRVFKSGIGGDFPTLVPWSDASHKDWFARADEWSNCSDCVGYGSMP